MNGIKYDKICLMLPTYGRSRTYLPRFITTALETWDNQSPISFGFCVNVNDFETKEYIKNYPWPADMDWWLASENEKTPNLAKYFNMLHRTLLVHDEPGTIVTMVGDDMEFRTHGWNVQILDTINYYNGVGVFWCNDGYIAKERCAVNLFLAQDFIAATEHPFMCEEFNCEMIDVVWTEIGRHTRTSHYLSDVMIRHDHNTRKSKENWDDTFKRLNVQQEIVHKSGGKARAKTIGSEIAQILITKGLTGDSIC